MKEGFTEKTTEEKDVRNFWHRIYNDKGEVVSRACMVVHYREAPKDNFAVIERVRTMKGYERQGFAKRVILRLIDKAKEERCYKVVLMCQDHNVEFYEKCGFHKDQSGMRINLMDAK